MKHCVWIPIVLFALAAGSCVKTTPAGLSYGIDSVSAVYINFDDTTDVNMRVRFLAGSYTETVKQTFTGLPSKVKLVVDTVSGEPTFTAAFRFAADSASPGTYPVQLVSYSKTTGYRVWPLSLVITNKNCGQFLAGNYTGTAACNRSNGSFAVEAWLADGNAVYLSNPGGFGVTTAAYTTFDCNTNTLNIARQDIGNGITMSGSGTFTDRSMTIKYVALNTPSGRNDTCTMVLSK